MFNLYDFNRAQMYGGAKCTVTNNLSLLRKVNWYARLFNPPCQMKDSPYEKTIVPEAKGFIQVLTMQERKCSEVFCYYPHNFKHEYSGLSIFKLSFEVKTSVKSETLHNEI